jgi:phosphotransferase system  glucose/maltose/N-acetylglucosamine-specific IIC component
MSLDKAHKEQMNKLDELIKTAKERKSTKFMELIVASIVGVVTSKLYDAFYSTPIASAEDNVTRGFFFVILLVVITAFLFLCANWTDILHDIRNRRKKPS